MGTDSFSFCRSLLRSCVSIWTAGGWTADWVSASSCSTPSSSSAPLALRGYRGCTHSTHTQSYKKDAQPRVFRLHCCHYWSNVLTDEFSFHFTVAGQRYYDNFCLKATLFTFDKQIFYIVLYGAHTAQILWQQSQLTMHYVSQQIYKVLNLYYETKNII